MLAMVVNDYACLLVVRGALESIASKLAPTGSLFYPLDLSGQLQAPTIGKGEAQAEEGKNPYDRREIREAQGEVFPQAHAAIEVGGVAQFA